MTEFSRDLQFFADVIAQWADDRPAVKNAYIFGSHVRGDARVDSDLDLAIELVRILSEEAFLDWCEQETSELAGLKADLAVPFPLHVHKCERDAAWPAIREAAKNPVLVVGKVICCATPKWP